MKFGLIVIGDEILSGRRQDKHLPRTIEILAARGHELTWAQFIGDDRPRITAALKAALDSGDAVFSCGGIGATPDDHTRQCAALASGRDLALHPEAKRLIEQRMREMAAEQGLPFDAGHADNLHRLNMGVFPVGATIIPNPYNKIPGFSLGDVHFVPGFPVMAHPMLEWVLDQRYGHLRPEARAERALFVQGGLEATLTPLMESLEAQFAGVKVFSLPSVDHPQRGRHIELGVKGAPEAVAQAFDALVAGLRAMPEVRFSTE
ncbi:MAG: competence/damage-inducible protein A [Vitreoscilla sp.]|nr:competence/damage-inducible protein A [Burkholderiales bacterium]MBP6338765.1 competence/damage-inducible protein A [Vitreoscilla sp.]MBP6676271.1 competence/damage-inducible protein A [Vitreoscilla sp.]